MSCHVMSYRIRSSPVESGLVASDQAASRLVMSHSESLYSPTISLARRWPQSKAFPVRSNPVSSYQVTSNLVRSRRVSSGLVGSHRLKSYPFRSGRVRSRRIGNLFLQNLIREAPVTRSALAQTNEPTADLKCLIDLASIHDRIIVGDRKSQ